jgi:hypothetical protein
MSIGMYTSICGDASRIRRVLALAPLPNSTRAAPSATKAASSGAISTRRAVSVRVT